MSACLPIWARYAGFTAAVGSGAGAVALSGVRSRSHFSPGFPCGPLHCGDHGQVAPFPAPAASNRACGSPAHGSPTPFTAGIRPFPPGSRKGLGATTIPDKADQAELVRGLEATAPTSRTPRLRRWRLLMNSASRIRA